MDHESKYLTRKPVQKNSGKKWCFRGEANYKSLCKPEPMEIGVLTIHAWCNACLM